MSDTQTPASDSSLRIMALLGYGLLLLACSNGVTGIVGVVIAYIKRDEARGTVYESHFSNMITVFWAAAVMIVLLIAGAGAGMITVFAAQQAHDFVPAIGIAVAVYGVMLIFAVWYLYRVIKGFIRALDGRAY